MLTAAVARSSSDGNCYITLNFRFVDDIIVLHNGAHWTESKTKLFGEFRRLAVLGTRIAVYN